MSVVITNHEMPECCDVCLFSDWSNLHQTCSCKLKEYEPGFQDFSIDYRIRRSDICPLEERKKGKWKYEGCDTYSCPFCGDTHVDDGDVYYFCKVCGADMRGEKENNGCS